MATGGDGYPNFVSRMTTQDIMEQVLADYVDGELAAHAGRPAAPNGRINCTDSNGATAPNCPVWSRRPDGDARPIRSVSSARCSRPTGLGSRRRFTPSALARVAVLVALLAAGRCRGATLRARGVTTDPPRARPGQPGRRRASSAGKTYGRDGRAGCRLVWRARPDRTSRRSVTDGEGHFTIGAIDPARGAGRDLRHRGRPASPASA